MKKIKFSHTHGSYTAKCHLESNKHKNLKKSGKKQENIVNLISKHSSNVVEEKQFFFDLTEALVKADIPLYKLQNAYFESFLFKYTKNKVPDRSTLSKNYLTPLYNKKLESIINL
jgi:hypothetical protein